MSFVFYERAKKSSVNRPRGRMNTKPISYIEENVGGKFLIENVIQEIRERWPRRDQSTRVQIQQDNADPHIKLNDPEFNAAALGDQSISVCLYFQAPDSSNMNIIDLRFFRAIQTIQYQKPAPSIDEPIADVEDAFREVPYQKSN